jgi:Tfp pilus assembly protein PilZ
MRLRRKAKEAELASGGDTKGGRENRRAPRFPVREKVNLKIWGMDYAQDGKSIDASSGGVFVQMDPPFPVGTRVVTTFPDVPQSPEINGEVVYSRGDSKPGDAKPNGVGVQFTDLTEERQATIDAMLTELVKARGLVADGARETGSPDAVWAEFLAFSAQADAKDFYGALKISSDAAPSAIMAAIQKMQETFAQPPAALAAPRQARIKKAAARLEQLRAVLLHPQRRVEFDVINGHLDGLQALAKVNAEKLNLEGVRSAFRAAHREHAQLADALAEEAREAVVFGNHSLAVEKATQALVHDPFNERLRMAMRSWNRQVQTVKFK